MIKTSERRNMSGGSTRQAIEKFNKAAENMENKLKTNPFSDTYVKKEFDKKALDYARPTSGSKTEARAKRAGDYVTREIIFLCETIYRNAVGTPPNCVVLFGPLFQIYSHYSDKLVGMLIRARKYGLVEFEGEMLYQRQDDHKPVRLLKTVEEIREIIRFSGDPVNCIAIRNPANDSKLEPVVVPARKFAPPIDAKPMNFAISFAKKKVDVEKLSAAPASEPNVESANRISSEHNNTSCKTIPIIDIKTHPKSTKNVRIKDTESTK